MDYVWLQFLLLGALSIMAAFSIFFCFVYRDRTFILFAFLALIPALDIFLRPFTVETNSLESLRWGMICIGWSMALAYVHHLFRADEDRQLSIYTHVVLAANAVCVLVTAFFPELLNWGMPLLFCIMVGILGVYTSYRYRTKYPYGFPCVLYATLTLLFATAFDWYENVYSIEGTGFMILYALLVISGVFSLAILKLRLSNHLAQEREENRLFVEQRQKMTTIGEISSTIAHEIKNPLAALVYATDLQKALLAQDPPDKAKLERINTNIENTALEIGKIVNSLSSVSRHPQHDPMQVLRVQDIVQKVVDLFQIRLRSLQIELRVSRIPEHLKITCRETQICQVLLNLLNNAFDAVQSLDEQWIAIDASETEAHVVIRVTDSGKGIPAKIQDKMLQAFFTTKDKGKGTGLGLTICKNIMSHHEGKLSIKQDAPNTCFEVMLPK